jgi:ABC-type antimicrobial peptide transport system permease subunit
LVIGPCGAGVTGAGVGFTTGPKIIGLLPLLLLLLGGFVGFVGFWFGSGLKVGWFAGWAWVVVVVLWMLTAEKINGPGWFATVVAEIIAAWFVPLPVPEKISDGQQTVFLGEKINLNGWIGFRENSKWTK